MHLLARDLPRRAALGMGPPLTGLKGAPEERAGAEPLSGLLGSATRRVVLELVEEGGAPRGCAIVRAPSSWKS